MLFLRTCKGSNKWSAGIWLCHMVQTIYAKLMHLVFPLQCVLCRSLEVINELVCACCTQKSVLVAPLRVALTRTRSSRVFSALAYQGSVVRLIHRKYHGDYLASCELARLMVMRYQRVIGFYDFLIPVPMHWSRELWRGFNHAICMSNEISRITGVPTLLALHRIHNARVQRGLSALEREANVKGSMVLHKDCHFLLADKKILLIDDVYTTGSTARQAAKILLPGRPTHIDILVAARAL